MNGSQYEVQFSVHKIGSRVSITIADQFDYTATKSYTIKNTPILLELNPIYYGDEKITRYTLAESKVSAAINKKTFHGIADKKGKFSINIPSGKTGSKISVKSVAPNTCYNSKSTTVQKISSNIFIMNFVFPNTTTLKVNCENVFKDDVVKVSIGGNGYTKNITADAKDKNLTFSIKKAPVGTNVKAVIYDKYGVKRNQSNSKVYLSDKISVGMTQNQVLQTA